MPSLPLLPSGGGGRRITVGWLRLPMPRRALRQEPPAPDSGRRRRCHASEPSGSDHEQSNEDHDVARAGYEAPTAAADNDAVAQDGETAAAVRYEDVFRVRYPGVGNVFRGRSGPRAASALLRSIGMRPPFAQIGARFAARPMNRTHVPAKRRNGHIASGTDAVVSGTIMRTGRPPGERRIVANWTNNSASAQRALTVQDYGGYSPLRAQRPIVSATRRETGRCGDAEDAPPHGGAPTVA